MLMMIDNNRCRYYIVNRKELDIYLLESYSDSKINYFKSYNK